jgi:hypothetical protein
MTVDAEGRERRHVHVQTTEGIIQGYLLTSPLVLTLTDLNIAGTRYMTIHDPRVLETDWNLGKLPVSVGKENILYVTELDTEQRGPEYRAQSEFFLRLPLRLWLQGHCIDGLAHVPPGTTAITRLKQSNHAFVALTSVKIQTPQGLIQTPFVAVNRAQILAVQEQPEGDHAGLGITGSSHASSYPAFGMPTPGSHHTPRA